MGPLADDVRPVGRPSRKAASRPLVQHDVVQLMVNVFAALSPICSCPTGVVPVFATQPLTIFTPLR